MHKISILATALLFSILNLRAQYCTNSARYTDAQFFDSTQITVGNNVQFGVAQDFQGNPYTLRMDLYYPNLNIDVSPKRPFVLMFHGGGFTSGDKQSGDIRDLCVHLALRGYVCASVNYRLGHDFSEYGEYKARYRAIQDGNAALRYIVNSANTIRVDTSWLFVGGQSAGSLLALGMVYADQSELDSISLLYNTTAASAELGNLHTSGNTLTNTYSIKGVFNNWGGAVKTEMDRNEMIPTIAFHGLKDTVVRIDSDNSFLHYTLNGSRAIHSDLIANTVCSEITIDTIGEHGIFRNASSIFRAKRASCFFKSIFCGTCSNFSSTDSIPATCSNPLAISESKQASNLKVFPNPFEGSVNIQGADGPKVIKIYNCFGQMVYTCETSYETIEPDLSPGVYFVNIKQNKTDTSHTIKLIRN